MNVSDARGNAMTNSPIRRGRSPGAVMPDALRARIHTSARTHGPGGRERTRLRPARARPDPSTRGADGRSRADGSRPRAPRYRELERTDPRPLHGSPRAFLRRVW